jgi:hypothetical protein
MRSSNPLPPRFLLPLLVALFAGPLPAQEEIDLEPDADNFRDWVEFIAPSKDELAWEGIGWRNAFWPAVEEARKLGRPILLWTMNGHPLGCT